MMNAIVRSKLPEIKDIMQNFGVVKAYLFGSAAIDTMTEESDVDLIVRFDPTLSYTDYGNNYFDLIYALQDLLKKNVDIVSEETISNSYLLERINSQKIAVL